MGPPHTFWDFAPQILGLRPTDSMGPGGFSLAGLGFLSYIRFNPASGSPQVVEFWLQKTPKKPPKNAKKRQKTRTEKTPKISVKKTEGVGAVLGRKTPNLGRRKRRKQQKRATLPAFLPLGARLKAALCAAPSPRCLPAGPPPNLGGWRGGGSSSEGLGGVNEGN